VLYQIPYSREQVESVASGFVQDYVFRAFCQLRGPGDNELSLLADSVNEPQLLIAKRQGSLMVAGNPGLYSAAARDLLEGRVEMDPPWDPSQYLDQTLEETQRPGLFCNSTPLAFWQALQDAGFDIDPDDSTVANIWYLTGEPRFSHLVQHECRLGRGTELWELVRKGISYDPEGEYVRLCLENGPSFVCEDNGVPVCWSATHLSGTMAMIYTPDEFRRKGYARSLAAMQIDYMLEHYGIACCHIISTNTPSQQLVSQFGLQKMDFELVWRMVFFPKAG